MLNLSTLVFARSFTGTNVPRLWSRIYEEYVSLSKKTKLIVVADEISSEQNENLSLIQIRKSSLPINEVLHRALSCFLIAINQRKKYDLVFIRVMGFSDLTVGILAKKILKKKLIVWLSNSETIYTGIRKKIYKFIVKKALSTANAIASSSDQVVKDVESFFEIEIDREKVTVIKQGINLTRFKPENIQNQENLLLCVARIQKIKGIENLIKAIPFVIKKIPNIKLKIVGQVLDPNYFNDLKELVAKLNCEKNVEFVGPIPHDQINQLYNSSKIFLLTSRSEGHSNSTFEAMACGKPVIISPCGTASKLIEDGINGFLVDAKQTKLLSQKIILLLKDKNYREKIGNAAKNTVKVNCDWDSFIADSIKLFNKIKVI